MRVYVAQTDALGDFLNCFPVLSGLQKTLGNYELVIKQRSRRFKGIREFLLYQDLFTNVFFEDEVTTPKETIVMNNWDYREESDNDIRPTETCRYENWLKDAYNLNFRVDDDVEIKFPNLNIDLKDTYYIGDRWLNPMTDERRTSNTLSHLNQFEFLDYNNDLLTNCYIIKKSSKPFITSLTGVAVLADLLNKETYVTWNQDDWQPQFRRGENITWDNGKDIDRIFKKHFYGNRKSKLIHIKDLENYI